jgi:hypothetical protein
MPYELRDDRHFDHAVAKATYGHINRRNHLLIRGLGALLKANLLASHNTFHAESCMSLYVALDASFQLILARLRRTKKNPTAIDAGAFVERAFGEPTRGFKYFEDFYSDRLMTLHPVSREGVYPDVPVSMSDFYQLRRALIAVFRYLVTGVAETIE